MVPSNSGWGSGNVRNWARFQTIAIVTNINYFINFINITICELQFYVIIIVIIGGLVIIPSLIKKTDRFGPNIIVGLF